MDLLSALGLTCVKAPGEAEAYCAHLNMLGVSLTFTYAPTDMGTQFILM